jgi:hypothetical protein
MMKYAISVIVGLVFGLRLIAGDMTDPAKVKGYFSIKRAKFDPRLVLTRA